MNLPPPEVVSVLQAGVGVAYLMATAGLGLARPYAVRVLVVLVAFALAIHVGLVGWRWQTQQQAPLVTRYEDFTFDALVVAALYLAVAWRWPTLRRAAAPMLVVAAALTLGALAYSQAFYPWSPALRIIWLQIHAPLNSLSIALASLCAALALAGGVVHAPLCARLLWWVTLVWSAMVATGAYWAYLAWGRFWGWDPIESWALATALAYAAVCHLMLNPAWGAQRVSRLALVPYAMLLFTTYGLLLVKSSIHGQYLFK
jgi:ABC-type transport system involved in cytochrome c biogenesis permease subunit